MSSIPTPVQPLSSGKLTAESAQEQLSSHLKQTARFIRGLDIMILLCSWLVLMMTTWLIGSAIDHWLFALPVSLRWVLWIALVGTTLWYTITQLLPLLVRRINPTYAAKRIEQIVPEFKNGLIAWLELQAMPDHGVPKGVMAALSYRAVRFIGGYDPSSTVDTGPLVKRAGAMLLLILALALYAMLSPKSLLESGKRLAFPWLNASAPTRVHILEVSPGSAEVTFGVPLAIAADVRGLRQGEAISACYNTLDGQYTNQHVPLTPTVEGLKYNGTIKTGSIGLEHDIEYWIEAGDAISKRYRISLSPLPSLAVERVRVEFPKYTRLEPREFAANADIEGLEGSTLQVWGSSNQELDRARLVINPQLNSRGLIDQAGEYIDMKIDSQAVHGTCVLFPSKQSFCLNGYNSRGDSNINPVVRPINVYTDIPPEVQLVGPEDRVVKISPTSRLTIEVRASDTDFGLSKAQLDVKLNRIQIHSHVLLENADQEPKPVLSRVMTTVLDVAKLKVSAGDKIELVAIAFDNRHDPSTQTLSPNQKQSVPLILEVVAPQEAKIPPELQPKPADKKDPTDKKGPISLDKQKNEDKQQPDDQRSDAENRPSSQNDSNSQPGIDSEPHKTTGEPRSSEKDSSSEPNPSGDSNTKDDPAGNSASSADTKESSKSTDNSNKQDPSKSPQPGASSQDSSAEQSNDPSKQDSQSANGNQSSEAGQQNKSAERSKSQQGSKANNKPESSSQTQNEKSPKGSSEPSPATGDQSRAKDRNDQPVSEQSASQRAKDEETLQKVKEYMEKQQSQEGSKSEDSEGANEKKRSEQESSKQEGSKQEGSKQEGSKQEGSKQEGSKQEGSKQEGSKQEGSKQEGSKQEGSKQEGSKQEGSKQEGSKQEGSKQEGSKQEGSKQDGSKQDGSKQEGSKQEGSKQEGTKQEGTKQEGTKQEGSKQEGSKQEGSKQEGSKQEGSKQEGSKQEGSKQEGSKQEGSKQEGSKQEGSKQEGSKQEGSKQEGSKQEGSKQEGSKQEGSKQEGSKQGGSKQEGSKGGEGGSGKQGKGQISSGSGGSGQGGAGGDVGSSDPTDPNFAKQTTDLTLDYLKRQRQQPDPELLKELNWSERDLRDFIDRYQSAKDMSAKADALESDKEELSNLRSGSGQGIVGASGAGDAYRDQLDSGGRQRPPENLRKRVEAFQEALKKARQ